MTIIRELAIAARKADDEYHAAVMFFGPNGERTPYEHLKSLVEAREVALDAYHKRVGNLETPQ